MKVKGILTFTRFWNPVVAHPMARLRLLLCLQFRTSLPENLPARNFLAASAAGMIGTLLTAPIWLIKTHMQLQEKGRSVRYPSMTAGFSHVVRTEGVRGLFRVCHRVGC